jgi:hypothetical protein
MTRWCPGECTDAPDVVIADSDVNVAVESIQPALPFQISQDHGGDIIINGIHRSNSVVNLFDLSGRPVYKTLSKQCKSTVVINKSSVHVSPGLYVIAVKNSVGNFSRTIGVQ